MTAIYGSRFSGHDALICCEALEHLPWGQVQPVLTKFHASAPYYLIISVPYIGFQIVWRLYLNAVPVRSKFFDAKLNSLRRFRPGVEPWRHKSEAGYRAHSLSPLAAKVGTLFAYYNAGSGPPGRTTRPRGCPHPPGLPRRRFF